MNLAHSVCSSFQQLADESRDLSQAEKKITVVKDEQIHKMTTIFTQNGNFEFILFYFQLQINHVIHQQTAQSLNKWSGPRAIIDRPMSEKIREKKVLQFIFSRILFVGTRIAFGTFC